MITTTVINLHRKPTPYYDIYIGQRIRFHPNKYPQSKWGNQFTKRYGSIPTRIQLYAEWIQTQPHLLAALPELRGKVLGCWCVERPIDYVRENKVCYGEVLLQLINNEKFEIQGVEILHFEGDKIKEAWTMGNLAELVQ